MAMTIGSIAIGASSSVSRVVQNAQREVAKAEQTAQRLRTEADAAQRSADQEQSRADTLETRVADANARTDSARSSLAAQQASSNNGIKIQPAPEKLPVINTTGQATGLILSAIA